LVETDKTSVGTPDKNKQLTIFYTIAPPPKL